MNVALHALGSDARGSWSTELEEHGVGTWFLFKPCSLSARCLGLSFLSCKLLAWIQIRVCCTPLHRSHDVLPPEHGAPGSHVVLETKAVFIMV